MSKRTPLYEQHLAAGGQMVPFGGWDMPLHYGSQIEEHHVVRRRAGVFDVSHMAVVDISGKDAEAFLRRLLANDVANLASGQALYSCMLNATGGVVDDLIAYRRQPGAATPYRLVVNAGTRDKDLAWMAQAAHGHAVSLAPRDDLAMLAVQGPETRALAHSVLPAPLASLAIEVAAFHAAEHGEWFVARTGYTGEDGWEIILPAAQALRAWSELLAAGVQPCGLGARDTLRLEAGMNLYGQDMDDDNSPLVSGLGWTIAWEPADRAFIGRAALEQERAAGPPRRLVGLLLEDRGVMRREQQVITTAGVGSVTSGGFSPTMGRSIALARVPAGAAGSCQVEIRGAARAARIVRPPFVRGGRVLVN
jgi:aminomethyltransferase